MPEREEKPTRKPLPPDNTSEELMAKVFEDPPTDGGQAVYPAGTTLTTADGRAVTVEELGYRTHSKPDSSKRKPKRPK